jgi:hypothetical protein
MNEPHNTGFADRLKTASEAKRALMAKFQAKPMVTDPHHAERAARRAAELGKVREDRALARAAARQAAAEAKQAEVEAQAAIEAASLDAVRGARKQRKLLTKAEAKSARDAKYAARKARQ